MITFSFFVWIVFLNGDTISINVDNVQQCEAAAIAQRAIASNKEAHCMVWLDGKAYPYWHGFFDGD